MTFQNLKYLTYDEIKQYKKGGPLNSLIVNGLWIKNKKVVKKIEKFCVIKNNGLFLHTFQTKTIFLSSVG